MMIIESEIAFETIDNRSDGIASSYGSRSMPSRLRNEEFL